MLHRYSTIKAPDHNQTSSFIKKKRIRDGGKDKFEATLQSYTYLEANLIEHNMTLSKIQRITLSKTFAQFEIY